MHCENHDTNKKKTPKKKKPLLCFKGRIIVSVETFCSLVGFIELANYSSVQV